MAYGIEVYDSLGNKTLDITKTITRVINATTVSGGISDSYLVNDFFSQESTDTYNAYMDLSYSEYDGNGLGSIGTPNYTDFYGCADFFLNYYLIAPSSWPANGRGLLEFCIQTTSSGMSWTEAQDTFLSEFDSQGILDAHVADIDQTKVDLSASYPTIGWGDWDAQRDVIESYPVSNIVDLFVIDIIEYNMYYYLVPQIRFSTFATCIEPGKKAHNVLCVRYANTRHLNVAYYAQTIGGVYDGEFRGLESGDTTIFVIGY